MPCDGEPAWPRGSTPRAPSLAINIALMNLPPQHARIASRAKDDFSPLPQVFSSRAAGAFQAVLLDRWLPVEMDPSRERPPRSYKTEWRR
jgi:hypothetical protein